MKTRMLLRAQEGDRERHLDTLARFLGADDVLVVAVDTYREDTATLHVPLDPHAEIVAVEPPLLRPGGVTELTSYLVCRGSTSFKRVRLAAAGPPEEADVELAAVRRGAAS